MSAVATPHRLDPAAVNAALIRLIAASAIVFGVFLSGFVIREPAPYELYMAGLLAVWALFGLRISRTVAPLLVLFVLFNLGGAIAMTQMADIGGAPMYVLVSLFLAFTSVFFAAVIERQASYLPLIFKSWTAAAVVTALLGIGGYFGLFPGGLFTLYDRAAGAFQDPNVFGPYLAAPGLYLLHTVLTGGPRRALLAAPPLAIIGAGLFLSFSRGAWGLFAAAAVIMVACLFLQSTSTRFRLRLAFMCLLAMVAIVLLVLVVLQLPGVSDLFTLRAQLVQEYDSARLGRFARFGIGFLLALEQPFGIGPLVFGTIYGEDTHNIWLKALMDYSWLGFVCWVAIMVWTVAGGFRILFRARLWQPFLLVAYATFLGHLVLGTVIDMDHWRHFYLLIGLIWGAMALERRHEIARRLANPVDRAPPSEIHRPRFGA